MKAGKLAEARRLYHHVLNGGTLTPNDVSFMVVALEEAYEAEERMNPEAVRIQANGPALFYTYPEQDSSIPEGYRRVVTEIYLEPYAVPEGEERMAREEAERFVAEFYAVDVETAREMFSDEVEAYIECKEKRND